MYIFTIYYSQEFKLWDLTVTFNNKFHSHYHLTKKYYINKIISSLCNPHIVYKIINKY